MYNVGIHTIENTDKYLVCHEKGLLRLYRKEDMAEIYLSGDKAKSIQDSISLAEANHRASKAWNDELSAIIDPELDYEI